MSGNTSPGASRLPAYRYSNTTMTPYVIKTDSLRRGPRSVLTNAVDTDQKSPASRKKFVHFAPNAVDNEFNEFKTKSSDGKQINNVAPHSELKDSKMKRVASSMKSFKANSSCYDLSSTQIQSFHRRTNREKPIERRSRMEPRDQNDTPSQNRQFKLAAANTSAQYPPRVPSPPMNRDTPPTPRIARLPTPDFENIFDDRPNFCDCLGCYEAGRSRGVAESGREASAFSKMEDQYKSATAYIRDRRPVVRQQMQALDVVPRDDSHVCDLMRMGYPRSVAVTALEAYRYDFEKAATFLEYKY